jgi:pimeloyl-ACP methyl ester carboxylesterase
VGANLRDIVDAAPFEDKPEKWKFFDILGFDPRGIGWTEPRAYCMADPAASWSWTLRESTEGILGSSDAALGRLWSMSHSWGASCKEAMDAEDGFDIKQYMSTALVARDMLTIIERHADWVAAKLPSRNCHTDTALYKPEETKLQYWGFSYGTFLGSTFASMFPDRVGRVILDGVVSSYDYLHSLANGSLTDTQKAMDSFYTYCLSSSCPLAGSNATFDTIKSRVESIVDSLYHAPLPITSTRGPEILTYSDIKNILFSALYSPQIFPFLAVLLLDIEARTGNTLDNVGAAYRINHIFSCPLNDSLPATDHTDTVPTYAILCGDGIEQPHTSLSAFEAYWNLLESMSPAGGAIWSMLRLRCLAWRITPLSPFHGPFGARNTSHPILFLANTADPVTPLRSARLMHSVFPGSGLVVSDHAGHCSISEPDACTLGYVARYFQTGRVEGRERVCVPRKSAWSLNSTEEGSRFYDPSLEGMGVESDVEVGVEVVEAGREMARKVVENDLFGVGRLVGGRGMEILRMAGMQG